MEVKTSLLDNMIGVGDMVLLEPLSEDSFINNLKKRFDHSEIYALVGGLHIHTRFLGIRVGSSSIAPQQQGFSTDLLQGSVKSTFAPLDCRYPQ
ncbi:Myosin-Ib [Chelonia mydas]|uniref:Myosin-Ib n=1 Tax=Chelonia mydas TaxID=8469 RepID=M7B2C2_CHEMY|nr:Myosin-Ib [Chelonia mydas]